MNELALVEDVLAVREDEEEEESAVGAAGKDLASNDASKALNSQS